ncbi:hypothetical protein D3C80_1952670 [compost metagenome]
MPSRVWGSKPARPNTPACFTSATYMVLSPALQVKVMPSTTSKALSLRRWTLWLRFICSCGWACSLNTAGAPGTSKETSLA